MLDAIYMNQRAGPFEGSVNIVPVKTDFCGKAPDRISLMGTLDGASVTLRSGPSDGLVTANQKSHAVSMGRL